MADELRAKTRAWPGGGAEEPRPLSVRSGPAAARPLSREPSAHSLPLPAPQSAPLAALNRSFSRLTFSETAASGVASRPPGQDWMATGGPTSWGSPSPLSPGLQCLQTLNSPLSPGDLESRVCQQVQPPHRHRSRDTHNDLPPQHRPLEDSWALLPESYRYLSHSTWADSAWGEDTFRGLSGSSQSDSAWGEDNFRVLSGSSQPAANGGATRPALHSGFQSDQEKCAMASDPVFSDQAVLTLLQRSQRTGARLGDP